MTGSAQARILASFFFFQKAAFAFLTVIFTSMFLKEFGAAGLPWFYVAHTIFFITSQLAIMHLTRLNGRAILGRLLPLLGIVTFVLAFSARSMSAGIIFAMLVLVKSSETHANQSFFDVSGQMLPVRESKKRLPGIMASGMIGSVVAGLSLRFLLGEGSMGVFIALAALTFFAAFWLLPAPLKSVSISVKENAAARKSKIDGLHGVASSTRRYVWMVVAMSAAGTFTCSLIDFLFNGRVSLEWADSHQIATFLGLFQAMVDLTVLTIQGTLGGWFFRKLPLSVILSIRPASLCVLSLAVWWHPLFLLVAASQFLMRTSTNIFMSPAWVLLLEPLPTDTKIYARRLLNIFDAVITLIIGLSLLAYTRTGGGVDQGLYLMDAVLYAATLLLTGILIKLYPLMIQDTLESAPADDCFEAVAGVRFLPRRERIRHLQGLLNAENLSVRQSAIKECCTAIDDDMLDILLTTLAREEHGPNVTLIVRAIMSQRGAQAGPALVELLHPKQDSRLLADLLEAVGTSDFQELEDVSARFLDFSERRVRGAAIINLLRHGHQPELMKKALETLYQQIKSSDPVDRAATAMVIGRIGLPAFLPALMELADDSHETAALKALKSLSGFRQPEVIEFLAHRSSLPGKRGVVAKESLSRQADVDRESMQVLLRSLPDDERRRVGFWWQMIGSGYDSGLVQQLLRIEKSEIREALMQKLAEGDKWVAVILKECLVDNDGRILINGDPVWQSISSHNWKTLPQAAALISALGLTGDKKGEEILFDKTAEFARLTCLAGLAFPGQSRGSVIPDWESRLEVLLQTLAMWAGEPGAWHDAMAKARAADAFLNSVAQEFLEARLGKKFARILLPVLDKNSTLKDLNEGLKKTGKAVNLSMPTQKAQALLEQYFIAAGDEDITDLEEL